MPFHLVANKTNCLMCGCAVTPHCKCECHEDKRIAELERQLIEAGEQHLADEQSIRNMQRRIAELEAALREIAEHPSCCWDATEKEKQAMDDYDFAVMESYRAVALIARRRLLGKEA